MLHNNKAMKRPFQIAEKAAEMLTKALEKKGWVNGALIDSPALAIGESRIEFTVFVEGAKTTSSNYITTSIDRVTLTAEGYVFDRKVDAHKTRVSDHAAKYSADLYFRETDNATNICKAILSAIL